MARKSNGPKCLNCRRPLPLFSVKQPDGTRLPMGRGFRGEPYFCAVQCGYAWVVRWLRRVMLWR